MGIYLSTPSTEIALEEGSGAKVQFVVGEMQGWRKSMEDSHIALTDISDSQIKDFLEAAAAKSAGDANVSLFGVFDGHGGKEVAKFVKLKYPQLVIEQLALNGGDVAAALRESFHKVDVLLEDLQYASLLRDLRTQPNPCDKIGASNNSSSSGNPRPSQMSAPLEDSDSDSDSDDSNVLSHLGLRAKHLSDKPDADKLTSGKDAAPSGEDGEKLLSTQEAVKMIRDMLRKAAERPASETSAGTELDQPLEDANLGTPAESVMDSDPADSAEVSADPSAEDKASLAPSAPTESSEAYESSATSQRTRTLPNGLTVTVHPTDEITTSLGDALPTIVSADANEVSPHPQSPTNTDNGDEVGASILPPRPDQLGIKPVGDGNGVVAASRPTPDGGVTCNLRQHRIMAGCTAVVALHVGSQLFVANAGDSRGVLCRKDGQAFALSYDHKPQQDREINRIHNAGGFVNNVGRINGNLNLSRSLGDLKYKQLTHLAREEQIITAEPDITLTELQAGDRFFILACDGVWDCLTNQEACDFVTARLDAGKDAATITNELLLHCLADDTAKSQGIGCDNMTFLLVLLK